MMRSSSLALLSMLLIVACDKPAPPKAPEGAAGAASAGPVALGDAPLVMRLTPSVLEAGEREVRCVVSPAGAAVRWEINDKAAGEGETLKAKLAAGDEVACVVAGARAEARVTRATRLADTQATPDTLRHARRVSQLGAAATLVMGRDDAGLYGLWRLDRSSGALAQVMPLPSGPRLFDATTVGERALFLLPVSNQSVAWVSDGTPQGSYPLPLPGARAPGGAPTDEEQASFIAQCGADALIASIAEGGAAALWRTDGTIAGTKQVRALEPGWRWEQVSCAGTHITASARRGRTDHAIWSIDGGKELARVSRDPLDPVLLIGLLPPVGGAARWWRSDGVKTELMGLGADGAPTASQEWPAAEVARLSARVVDGQVFFVAHPLTINVLEGPPAGPLWSIAGDKIARVEALAEPVVLRDAGDVVFALSEQAIWRLDGGPARVVGVELGRVRSDSKSLLLGSQLYFVVERGAEALVCEAMAGAASCKPGCREEGGTCVEALVDESAGALWVAEAGVEGERQAWRNGLIGLSVGVSRRATLPRTMSGTSPATLARPQGALLYFSVAGGERGDEQQRWVTDGTPEGTRREDGALPAAEAWDDAAFKVAEGMVQTAKILIPERPAGLPVPILPIGGTRAIVLGKRDEQVGLWITDGGAGTRLLMESEAGGPRIELPLALLGDRLVFVATDPEHGAEPWVLQIKE